MVYEFTLTSESVKRSFALLNSNKFLKFRYIMFVIIDSGMALFAIQLVRVVLQVTSTGPVVGMDLVIGIHEMLNGISPTIILVLVSMRSFADEESFDDKEPFDNELSLRDNVSGKFEKFFAEHQEYIRLIQLIENTREAFT